MTAWLCVLEVASASRPGVVARLTGVFAERGISLTEVVAVDSHGRPTVVLAFAATPRLCDHLARRLARSPDVSGVRMLPADGRSAWELLGPRGGPSTHGGGWGG